MLARRLSAFCARIRPGNTAELASWVLYLGEEIDRRERMLDAALRATTEVPGERVPAQHLADAGTRRRHNQQIGS